MGGNALQRATRTPAPDVPFPSATPSGEPEVKRRRLIIALGAALGAPLGAFAPDLGAQRPRVRRIGLLLPAAMDAPVREWRRQLRDLGWIEGDNLQIETADAGGREARLPEHAESLVSRKVELVVAATTPAARAAMGAAPSIPLVFALVPDPLGSGLVSSLFNPGGRVTGVAIRPHDPIPRQIELLVALVPKLERIAELRQSDTAAGGQPASAEVRNAAARPRLALIQVSADKVADLDAAFAAAVREKAGGVVVAPSRLFIEEAKLVAELARKHRLATVFSRRDQVAAGGLASYGVDFTDGLGRTARYVDRILRGAKPAEMSVDQADRFRTTVNRSTVAALGLTISQTLHATVDEVID